MPVAEPVRPEGAHLVLEFGQPGQVPHLALRIERRHRLGPQPFAARRVDRRSPARSSSTCRSISLTRSPPWLTSATTASASNSWNAATAARAQTSGGAGFSERSPAPPRPSSHVAATTMPQASEVLLPGHRRIDGDDDALRAPAVASSRSASSSLRVHSASGRSSISSPSSSCRPRCVPCDSARRSRSRKPGARLSALSAVRHPRHRRQRIGQQPLHQPRRARRRRRHLPRPCRRAAARTAACPRPLPRAAICRPRRTRPAANCGPRNRSGSRARHQLRLVAVRPEQRVAAPVEVRAFVVADEWPAGRFRPRPSPPAPVPSSRRPARSARRDPGSAARARTHSAPARVLPEPRPPRISQVVQSPSGGSCSGRAQLGQSNTGVSTSSVAEPATNAVAVTLS